MSVLVLVSVLSCARARGINLKHHCALGLEDADLLPYTWRLSRRFVCKTPLKPYYPGTQSKIINPLD
eukprot:1317253-Amorphochlora_amoeboformis.AAC.1